MELEQSATKTIAIKMFDIIHDGKQKEKLRTNQFFSSLLGLVGVNRESPFVFQGYQMLHSLVSCLYRIGDVLEQCL
jgi:hypothetical protein